MARVLSLDRRVSGHWTNFECFLLKDENIHVGWIGWTSKNTFRLKKNPLTDHPMSPYTYILPHEVKIPIEEGIIRVTPEKIVCELKIPRGKIYGTFSGQFCIVDSYEPVNPDMLPKPHLSKDEFLHRLTYNWHGDVSEIFSKEIAINILSCPKSSYGIGGIGAQSLSPYGGKQDLIILNRSIKNLLPSDFLGRNKTYMYKPIRTKRDAESANNDFKRGASDEISYNYLFNLGPQPQSYMMPTQIPVIIPEARYIPDKWGLDRDVFDYQMSALLLTPYIEENIQDKLTRIVTKTGEDILRKSSLQTSLDNTGLLRLAKAWCRLEFKQSINEDDFSKLKNDFEEVFKEYFDIVEDAKETGATYHIPLTPMPNKMRLTVNANRIYKLIKKLSRENDYKRLSIEIIRNNVPVKEISTYDLDKGLNELVNAGYLLMHKNYTEFEIV